MDSPRAVACSWMTERQSSEMHSVRKKEILVGSSQMIPLYFTYTASFCASHVAGNGRFLTPALCPLAAHMGRSRWLWEQGEAAATLSSSHPKIPLVLSQCSGLSARKLLLGADAFP